MQCDESSKSKLQKKKKLRYFVDLGTSHEQKDDVTDLQLPPEHPRIKKLYTNYKKFSQERGHKLDQRENDLSEFLFGGNHTVEDKTSKEASNFHQDDILSSAQSATDFEEEEEEEEEEESDQIKAPEKRKAAWIDEEDESTRVEDVVGSSSKLKQGLLINSSKKLYVKTLRDKFHAVSGGTPAWADLENKESDEDENDIRKKTSLFLAPEDKLKHLPRGTLNFKEVTCLNQASFNTGYAIAAIDFQPDLNLALVAGYSRSNSRSSGVATLFQLDGEKNHKIKSIFYPKFPIPFAKFDLKKPQVIMSSNYYRNIFVYDIKSGKETKININTDNVKNDFVKGLILSPDGNYVVLIKEGGELNFYLTKSFSLHDSFQVPVNVLSAAFNTESTVLYTFGENGVVYVFDIEEWRCIHSFFDEGCVMGTAIAVSPNGKFIACGSSSGVVNMYDKSSVTSETPEPLKSFGSLVTPISAMAFNPTSEILAIASMVKSGAVRLIHMRTMTMFGNFPGNMNCGNVHSLAFSPDSKYLTIGTNFGKALLIRLLYY